MNTESFDNMTGDVLVAMFSAAKQWASDEMVDISDMGRIRGARRITDTHAGLPLPQEGDFIFEGTVAGIKREFLVRDYKVLWDRPKSQQ